MVAVEIVNEKQVSSKLFLIRGKVLNARNKKVITGASIQIWNTANQSRSDINGLFEIEIPDYVKSDSVMIEVRFSGYESKMISINRKHLPEFMEMEMQPKERNAKENSFSKLLRKFRLF